MEDRFVKKKSVCSILVSVALIAVLLTFCLCACEEELPKYIIELPEESGFDADNMTELSQGDFLYGVSNGVAVILSYEGNDEILYVPSEVKDGEKTYEVIAAVNLAFDNLPTTRVLVIPDTIKYVSNFTFRPLVDDVEIFVFVGWQERPDGWSQFWCSPKKTSIVNYKYNVKKVVVDDDNFEYVIYNDDTAEIFACKTDSEDVVVPSTIEGCEVVSVGLAFANSKNLKSISLPSTIRYMYDFSFAMADGLTITVDKTPEETAEWAENWNRKSLSTQPFEVVYSQSDAQE